MLHDKIHIHDWVNFEHTVMKYIEISDLKSYTRDLINKHTFTQLEVVTRMTAKKFTIFTSLQDIYKFTRYLQVYKIFTSFSYVPSLRLLCNTCWSLSYKRFTWDCSAFWEIVYDTDLFIRSLKLRRRRYIYYVGPQPWNSLPNDLKSVPNFNQFKSMVKRYLIQRLSSVK